MLATFDCRFCDTIHFAFSLFLRLYNLIPLRCYDAIMLNKHFLWRSHVEIQMVQKLVVDEKVVKMREAFEAKFTVFYKNIIRITIGQELQKNDLLRPRRSTHAVFPPGPAPK